MQTLQDTWDKLEERFKTIAAFRRVEKLPIERLIDDSFWDGLTGLMVPACYVVLKTDSEEGQSAKRESIWSLVLVAPSKPTRKEHEALVLAEACRAKLEHSWDGTYLFLQPGSKLTFLQVRPTFATIELEVYTTDYEGSPA